MAKTVVTHSDTYCPVSEFLKRVDWRSVAQWASDTESKLTLGAITADVNVAAALKSASGFVESVALLGERYTPSDLAALTGNAQALLYDIVSAIAMVKLWRRRPHKTPADQPPNMEEAVIWLDKLAEGKTIFGFQETMEAGRLEHEEITAAEINDRNGLIREMRRFFGTRADGTR